MRFLLLSLCFCSYLLSCQSELDCNCTEEYAPVCASDGQSYGNACKAACLGLTYTDGLCPETAMAVVRDTGPVALDGCGFLLEIDEQLYHPDVLDAAFQVDSLVIEVEFRRLLSNFLCSLQPSSYPNLEILSIQ